MVHDEILAAPYEQAREAGQVEGPRAAFGQRTQGRLEHLHRLGRDLIEPWGQQLGGTKIQSQQVDQKTNPRARPELET